MFNVMCFCIDAYLHMILSLSLKKAKRERERERERENSKNKRLQIVSAEDILKESKINLRLMSACSSQIQ